MKALALTALLFGGMAAPAGALDLADYYPGPLALTHALRAVDGRYYHFSGDVQNGLWSRSIDPGSVDYHAWMPDGMYYLGWQTPTSLSWSVPPEMALPRHWDPSTVWTRTYPYVLARRTAVSNVFIPTEVTVTMERVVLGGETLFYMHGGDAVEHEHWWISPCLPVRGGGCSPGFRGFSLISGGVAAGSAEFVEWVPRALVP